jgi:hypothetical protein
MALVLGLEIGDVVDIATHWMAVLSIDGRDSATVIRDDGRKIAVYANEMTEIMPEVSVGLGPDTATSRLRLLVDAPRHISISRRRA